MSELEAKYFVQSFVRFLHKEIGERNFSADVVESLEVAAQCLETAYNLPVDEATATSTLAGSAADGDASATATGSLAAASEKNVLSHIDIYELFQSACSLQPDRKLEAENIKNEGNCLMREEKYQEALRAYNRAITLDPTNPVFYCNRAAAHSRLNDYQKAADDCKMSLRYDPNYGKAYGRMGIAYSKLNKHDLALKAYQQALQLEPNNVDYLNNLNVAQQRLTETQAANAAPVPGSIQLPGGVEFPAGANALMDSLGQLLTQPGMQESFQHFLQDPFMQNMVSTFTAGNLGGAGGGVGGSPDVLASLAQQMQTTLQNNPNLLGNLENLFPQGPPGSGPDAGGQPPAGDQPPPQQ